MANFESRLQSRSEPKRQTGSHWLLGLSMILIVILVGWLIVQQSDTEESSDIPDIATSTDSEVDLIDRGVGEDEETLITEASDGEVSIPPLREHNDPELGLRFWYPQTWGVISHQDETGGCPADQGNRCFVRYFGINDPVSGQFTRLLAAFSPEYRDHPLPRGVQWPDQALMQNTDWQNDCQGRSDCTLLTRDDGQLVARYREIVRSELVQPDRLPSAATPSYFWEFEQRGTWYVIASPTELQRHDKEAKDLFFIGFISTVTGM